ncbi:RNA polymerase sigma factor [Luteibaculum oceani]|uniref:RNA polymerase sigma factor n=1 Tax=Luteibaculum oceani TaxID=1294296 RepID=A0A5C6V935_9FLAO|nr:RNA polymerase sigma factor [Luteibaculum oceani]TXC81649.1 RNA polymerase sigma factor [Luteibaculum oceani]
MVSLSKELREAIEGCCNNDRKSQEYIHRRYYQTLLPICLRYTRNMDQAEDILQNSFIKIFNSIDRYGYKGSFEGWLKRIVVNTSIDFHRSRKSDFLLLPEDKQMEDFDREEEGDEEWNYPYSPKQVMEAIQQLTPAYKMVFNLYVIEDYTHKEIADMLGVSIGTSKSNLLKAKARLRKILEENFEKTEL